MDMLISDLNKLPIFPYAEEFPYVTEDEEKELAQDLEINGQQHPIIIYNEQILDGRNRLRALQRTNRTTATVEYFEGTEFQAVEKVRALNILRRHLSVGQRAMAALAYLPYEEGEAKKREEAGRQRGLATMNQGDGSVTLENDEPQAGIEPPRGGKSRDIVAEKFNLSGPRIQEAKKVALNAPDLAEEVKAGGISLDGAVKQMKARNESREKKIRELEFEAKDLYREYTGGRLDLDDAYVTLINRQKDDARQKALTSNPAINLIETYARISDERLREFNLNMQKLKSSVKIDEALGFIAAVEASIATTKGALEKLRSVLAEEAE